MFFEPQEQPVAQPVEQRIVGRVAERQGVHSLPVQRLVQHRREAPGIADHPLIQPNLLGPTRIVVGHHRQLPPRAGEQQRRLAQHLEAGEQRRRRIAALTRVDQPGIDLEGGKEAIELSMFLLKQLEIGWGRGHEAECNKGAKGY